MTGTPASAPAPSERASPQCASASWRALGTNVVVRSADAACIELAGAAVRRELDAVDRACSRFRPDSELSLLNGRRGRPLQITPLFAQALELAISAASLTEGDVDPTLGRALELAGYDRDRALLPPSPAGRWADSPAPALTLRARDGWRTIELDSHARIARVPAGVRLDLGATAKAWAADRSAAAAHAAAGCGVLVSVGGDIAVAGASPREGWQVRVTDDHRSDPSAPGQTISIRCGGLATSSTAVLRWGHRGRTMHHILDPATGTPARTPWRTVSVAAADCAQANIASTAAIVRAGSAAAWLDRLGLPARLHDGRGRVVTVGAWPADRGGRGDAASARRVAAP